MREAFGVEGTDGHLMHEAAGFIARNPKLLDSGIMLSHYSAAVLFSPQARNRFVEPDLQPIPED